MTQPASVGCNRIRASRQSLQLERVFFGAPLDEALRLIQTDDADADRAGLIATQVTAVERERGRLVAAIATGHVKSGVVEVLRALEARSEALRAERRVLDGACRMPPTAQLRTELLDLAHSWRTVLAEDPTNARPIISSLLLGRVTYTPLEDGRWKLTGEATLTGLFEKVFSVVWRPQRDSVPLATFAERRRKPEDQCETKLTKRSEGGFVPNGGNTGVDARNKRRSAGGGRWESCLTARGQS